MSLSAPLNLMWRQESSLATAVLGQDKLYGITPDGSLVARNLADGMQLWAGSSRYVPGYLTRQGSRLFAYRLGEGFGYVDDIGASATERLAVSFGATADADLSAPVVDDRMVYLAVNQGLYAIDQDRGLLFGTALGAGTPCTVTLVGPRDILVINGAGIPTRYRVTAESFELVWTGRPHNQAPSLVQHPHVIAGARVIISTGSTIVAYNLTDGTIAWQRPDTPVGAMVTDGETVYSAYYGASISATRASDGAGLWHRQYIYDPAVGRDHGLALSGGYLFYGCTMRVNPDGALLLAINRTDGTYGWVSRSANSPWGGGIPVTNGERMLVYGGAHTAALASPSSSPRTSADDIQVTPVPLRGPASSFGSGAVRINLQSEARVSVAAYRERTGVSTLMVNKVNWSPGAHEITWNPAGSTGFSDVNQFGHVLVDIEEASGARYTLTKLIPVNTFPDIIKHWARFNVEIMVFNRYVSGYPDQLFRPDNLVTRAESSTIIAKTLGLEAPSPEFRTAFTDIAGHWARNHIMALEERGVVGGFAEPDGTFTFRPDLQMTRGQEARILVRAYAIPPAPEGFESKFTDMSGHWARLDVLALEAAGYVAGYQEADGTFTYRPEQNLTRAELCTLVVRIRQLSR
ncbi:MAG TPA: S-layer homology domain-containing protein [Symbiobacteriaceae bacterium]|nr:S-layer homology domain-containing protein [Symbiobacteriaceae bacterium]